MTSSKLPSPAPHTSSAGWEVLVNQCHDTFYTDLVSTIGCGAFDGGCVVVAEALQMVLGGQVVVLIRSNDHADHAAVLINGLLVDYDGPLPPEAFIARFSNNERHTFPITGYRPIRETDLPNAPRDHLLKRRLSSHLLNAGISASLGELHAL
ncbi:MAG: hypothetical protein ACFHHU_00645 [Porticoccaceae bacterium]